MTATLNDLSKEVISAITFHLHQDEILKLVLTSKALSKTAIHSLYQNPRCNGTDDAFRMFDTLTARPELRPLVETLGIGYSHEPEYASPSSVRRTFPVLPKCTWLSLQPWLGSSLIAACPAVDALKIENITNSWNSGSLDQSETQLLIPANLKGLETLRLVEFQLGAEDAIPMWESLRGRIKHVELSVTGRIWSPTMMRVSMCVGFTAEDLKAMSICASTLSTLSVGGRIAPDALQNVGEHLPNLTCVSFASWNAPRGMFDKTIPLLKVLWLDGQGWQTAQIVEKVAAELYDAVIGQRLPSLKRVGFFLEPKHWNLTAVQRLQAIAQARGWNLDIDVNNQTEPDD